MIMYNYFPKVSNAVNKERLILGVLQEKGEFFSA